MVRDRVWKRIWGASRKKKGDLHPSEGVVGKTRRFTSPSLQAVSYAALCCNWMHQKSVNDATTASGETMEPWGRY